jgi:hypothetical protein
MRCSPAMWGSTTPPRHIWGALVDEDDTLLAEADALMVRRLPGRP